MKAKQFFVTTLAVILTGMFTAANCKGPSAKSDYETVDGDPLKTRIYTLDNGLKVYMSVNKEAPRIQTYIAVRVGGKNDPAETTGLAHYFEHLMFKGTTHFGTSNYEAEKPLLDEIERLFEVYRKTTDEAERKALYRQIDSISNKASQYAIPNEYDKLMAAIGATGTNAYTNFDVTCYTEDIPSTQIENWAKIQADRFQNSVIRGFHTELEAVYEEYNMGLASDARTVIDTLRSMLFFNHPYGTQSVIGTQQHLKNPSITNIKRYYETWYVPNNMAICLSGDFDPDEMIAIIKKYFGNMKPNDSLPKPTFKEEAPITTPTTKEVRGVEAANVNVAWRIGGEASADNDLAILAASLLYNDQAGLIDLDLIHAQKVLSSYCYPYTFADYGMFLLNARPKDGQTLEQARDLLLEEVAKLRKGDFDESLLRACVANYKLELMKEYDSNEGRANAYVDAFVNGVSWADMVHQIERMEKITKADIVKFANEKLGENAYAVVFKREGQPGFKKIDKPEITPIATNRDTASAFLREIQLTEVKPIEPVFLDFKKDMSTASLKSGLPLLYKKNETTDVFELMYVFDMGRNDDSTLGTAFDYLSYLGTSKKSPTEIKKEFFDIACSFSANVTDERCYVSVSGLSENMPKALELMEELIADAKPDENVLTNLKADRIKARADAKLNQGQNFGALRRYVMYGPEHVKATTLTNDALKALTSDTLLAKVRDLFTKQHSVLYYGPGAESDVLKSLDQLHRTADKPAPLAKKPVMLVQTPSNTVMLAEYNAKQIYYLQYSNRGEPFDVANDPGVTLYNEYFGGSMNAIVFQEMRESRGLAYSANAVLITPSDKTRPYAFQAFVATQNDKMPQAIDAFMEIINNMPESEAAFKIAKDAILARLRTERTVKGDVLWAYLHAKDMGVDYDRNKAIFEKVQSMTLADVKAFQEKWIKGRTYHYAVLGNSKDIDMNKLRSLGEVKLLTPQDIFGY